MDDSFLVSDETGTGDFLLPSDVLVPKQVVLSLHRTECALQADVTLLGSVDVSEGEERFFLTDGAGIHCQDLAELVNRDEESVEFVGDGRVVLEVFGDDAELTF